MAQKQNVWGIDIGNSSLKAMRCCLSDEPGKAEVLSFDFIEHSKVLTQPGVNAREILVETLQTFLGRNSIKGDKIAISVSGQNTISRFLGLPPVDPKKIPDVIRYEAKQWLPFDLNDVVWSFQPLGVSQEEQQSDLLLDATVGMFAIKRDLAMRLLEPFLSRSFDVDTIQSSPMALYNYVAYDVLSEEPAGAAGFEEEESLPSLVILGVGTDASDVVITNGSSIWTRNIPIGGNTFTKALTKNLQLTLSKAEYLKRNTATAPDQKSIIQAMRTVFNDMVNEVNRSLEYYQTLNRKAKFSKILIVGNATKLLGLRQYLEQNLGYKVERATTFHRLARTESIQQQLFVDNLSSFGVCYGLVLQQLGLAPLKTNLIPKEIVQDRIVREKKPWALVAAASILLGLTIHYASASAVYNKVYDKGYDDAVGKVSQVQGFDKQLRDDTKKAIGEFDKVDSIGKALTSTVEGRINWLEILHTINEGLPKSKPAADGTIPEITDETVAKSDRIYIQTIDAVPIESFSGWFAPLKEARRYVPDKTDYDGWLKNGFPAVVAETEGDEGYGSGSKASASPADTAGAAETASPKVFEHVEQNELMKYVAGPANVEGANQRIVQITGYHYHNPDEKKDKENFLKDGGAAYLKKTLLDYLRHGKVRLPSTQADQDKGEAEKEWTMQELGISFPVLLYEPSVVEEYVIHPLLQPLVDDQTQKTLLSEIERNDGVYDERDHLMMGSSRLSGGRATDKSIHELAKERGLKSPVLKLRRFDFVIQFAWVETPASRRVKRVEKPASVDVENQEPSEQ